MDCDFRKEPGGAIVIACSRGRRTPLCSVCRTRPGTQLCDGPSATQGKTCDKPLCRTCAHRGGPNVDFCPEHRPGGAAVSPYAERARAFLREHTHRAARAAAVTRGCVVALLARPEPPPEGYQLAACPLCERPLWVSAETKTLAAENAVPAACVVCALRGPPEVARQ